MEIENEHLENQKKKFKSFEPVFSLRTGRFTGWTVGSSGPISVRSPSGLMTRPNRNGDRPAIGPAGPVRFLKPCFWLYLLFNIRIIDILLNFVAFTKFEFEKY